MVIIVVCSAAYVPAIKGGFVWDDDDYVTDNPLLTAPDGFYNIWFSTDAPSQYFPLTYTTYWVEYRLWGFNPFGYHVVNVAIHIANALLLWLVLRRLSIPGAWFASAVFALHPVQVESVAWITERKNVLMLFFSLLSVLCWMKFIFGSNSIRRAVLFYAVSLLLFALALFSKTTACMLPVVLVLILWLRGLPLTSKRWLRLVPFIAMGIGMGFFIMWWEKYHQGTSAVNLGIGPADKLLISGRALWFYLWELFWPVNLAFSYPRWNIDPAKIQQFTWPAAVLFAVAIAWLLRNRSGRGPITAILFFAATLFPMLGFFTLYTFVYTFVADHYQYAACIGPIALVAAAGAMLFGRSGKYTRFVIVLAAGVSVLTLGTLTWRQSRAYTSVDTLWLDTLKKNPDSWLAHGQIGSSLFKQGKLDETLIHLDRVLELGAYLKKVDPRAYSVAYYNKGLIFAAKGRLNDAVEQYRKSLELQEDSALVHCLFAEVLATQGKLEEAQLHYRRAIEIIRNNKAEIIPEDIRQRLQSLGVERQH